MNAFFKVVTVALFTIACGIDSQGQKIVHTKYGDLSGVVAGDVEVFRGIPYAAPPVGENRFKAPKEPAAWEGVFRATNDGPSAPHALRPIGKLNLDNLVGTGWDKGDNFLTLNLWRPLEGSDLPVMVWIHGGAFVLGKKNAAVYEGTNFARSGVICLTINYRLGMEGFMPMDGGDTNNGLRDILFALKWVQENIRAFGGDPANVTIFGESAGGMAVSMLVASPLSSGLFQKAIAQSGSGQAVRSLDVSHRITQEMAEVLKVTPDLAGFRSRSFEQVLKAQRKASRPGRIDLREANGIDPLGGIATFWPVYGDDVLPKKPLELLEAGAGKGINFLMTTNAAEANLFTVPTKLQWLPGFVVRGLLNKSMPKEEAKKLLKGYGLGDVSGGKAYTRALTDLGFRAPVRMYAAAHQGTTHVLEFDWHSNAFKGKLGAAHSIDIPLVFNTTRLVQGEHEILGTADASEEGKFFHGIWVAFAKTGQLNWEEYTGETKALFLQSKRSVVEEPTFFAEQFLQK